jgi:hypothetical protein
MKKALKLISFAALIASGVFLVLNSFEALEGIVPTELTYLFILIYLIASLRYHQMELKDKNAEIQYLKQKLSDNNSNT